MSATVFAIPCNHPAAKDGVFHCVPSFYQADHMRDDFEFIMVDTQKVIAQLQRDDPELLKHAESKFRGETAQQWLESTSVEQPRDMGHWTYSPDQGLGMSSGQAAVIKLVQEIDLPCFPIAVAKATGWHTVNELLSKVGYSGPLRPQMVHASRPMDLDC